MLQVKDIRQQFADLYQSKNFIKDKTGSTTIEIIGQSFIADESFIFGKPNEDYMKREVEWYLSQSLSVYDIPGKTPKIWEQVSDENGYINSNYGYLIYSKENGNQYENCYQELIRNKDSRRACMIYTRPSMWKEYNKNGMSDFICTNDVQYFIRDTELIANVQMRSNDAWAGYRNDYYWQKYVLDSLYDDLSYNYTLRSKKIIWNAGSLHLYANQYYLLEHYIKTGETSINKKEYEKLYNYENN